MTQAPDIATLPKTRKGRILLPYQERWRRDESDFKLWPKSRRIGATYAESNDATMSRLAGRRGVDYWFTSADESAAYEFGEYCRFWVRVSDAVADHYTEDIEDPKTGRSAPSYVTRFPSGCRITALTSNPRRFRSKGGDVGLDEFDYHDQPEKMWDAAASTATWGDRIRVLSTHNGEGTLFHRFRAMAERRAAGVPKKGDIPFSLHVVTIADAVGEGLVEKINEVRGTSFTREQFLARCRSLCRNEDQWNQEYMAIPSTDSTAWLPYELIEACEDDAAGDPLRAGVGRRYVGMDVGETEDLTVIWTLERVGDVLWTREVLVLRGEPLRVKEDALLARLRHPAVARACVDATGVGAQIAQAAERTGRGEGVKFTLATKDEMASPLRGLFEDRRIRIPGDTDLREDLHAIRMTRTAAGHPRFDAQRSEAGHADRFWALALACHAAATRGATPYVSVLSGAGSNAQGIGGDISIDFPGAPRQ